MISGAFYVLSSLLAFGGSTISMFTVGIQDLLISIAFGILFLRVAGDTEKPSTEAQTTHHFHNS